MCSMPVLEVSVLMRRLFSDVGFRCWHGSEPAASLSSVALARARAFSSLVAQWMMAPSRLTIGWQRDAEGFRPDFPGPFVDFHFG